MSHRETSEKRRLPMLGVLICVWAFGASFETAADTTAQTVFVNGQIYIGKARNPWATEVAVSGGQFVYVGDDVSALVGPDTVVYDLESRLVIPGLIDGHTHLGLVAVANHLIDMDTASTKAELLQNIRQVIEDNPDRDQFVLGYWPNEMFGEDGPHKSDLDRIESERPVIIYDDLTHSVWANSRALEVAGVTRDTPDIVPNFSFYKKDDDGEPTGLVTESAVSVFINNFQSVTPSVEQSMVDYANHFLSVGVTTILDAGNFGMDEEVFAALVRLDEEGRLPIRVHGSYTLFLPDEATTAVDSLRDLAERYDTANVTIDTLKVFMDGVVDNRTAAMLEDYLDTPGNSGEALLSREQVRDLALELEMESFNMHVHSVGDRATAIVLDGIEAAQEALGRPLTIRVTLAHLEFIKDSDFRRFKKLGIIANFTPHWAVDMDLSWYKAGIGDLAYDMQRGQPLLSDGARVSFSSDNTTESERTFGRDGSSPFVGMQVGHTRQDVNAGQDVGILPPISERLQLDDLLNGYSTDAAYQLGRSDIGMIAVGKRADLLVLNQNIFEISPYDIHRTKPVAILIDGELVDGELASVPDRAIN
ncbi:MAG: amidohydrolase [Woeseiaceae bacterium]